MYTPVMNVSAEAWLPAAAKTAICTATPNVAQADHPERTRREGRITESAAGPGRWMIA
jgi:hypothetical protein